MPTITEQLSNYVPKQAASIISRWIMDTGCVFKVSRSRTTKFGDYRAPHGGRPHRISVNHDLNEFAFLITAVHEFAHLMTWQEHRDRVKPHGKEWKSNFKYLMAPFFKLNIFPQDISTVLMRYMDNPAASSCTDVHLFRILRKYDPATNTTETVETLPANSYFRTKNGKCYQKLDKLKKRFKCKELSSGRFYLFSPIAEIMPIHANELMTIQQHIID